MELQVHLSRLRRSLALLTLAGLAPGAASPAAAEAAPTVVLSFTERVTVRHPPPHGEDRRTVAVRVSIGPRFVREDRGDVSSYVLDRERRRLVVLDHGARTWQEYPLPVRLEDHLGEDAAALLAAHARALDRVEAQPPAAEEVGGRATVRSAWTATLEDVEVEATWWLAEIDGADAAAYWELARSVAALHPLHRLWMAEVEVPAGLPVRQVLVTEDRFADRRERVLDDLEIEPGTTDAFRVPGEYRQRPARCFHHVAFGDDPACR